MVMVVSVVRCLGVREGEAKAARPKPRLRRKQGTKANQRLGKLGSSPSHQRTF